MIRSESSSGSEECAGALGPLLMRGGGGVGSSCTQLRDDVIYSDSEAAK